MTQQEQAPDDDDTPEQEPALEALPPAPAHIAELTSDCVERVRKALKLELDFTPDTLPYLDLYISKLPKDAVPQALALEIGAYFGEVVRRSVTGGPRWHAPELEPLRSRIEFHRFLMHFQPMSIAFEVLAVPLEDSQSSLIETTDLDRAQVTHSLEVLGAVTEEDYNRLTVRYEIVQHIAEVLLNCAAVDKRTSTFGPELYRALLDKADERESC